MYKSFITDVDPPKGPKPQFYCSILLLHEATTRQQSPNLTPNSQKVSCLEEEGLQHSPNMIPSSKSSIGDPNRILAFILREFIPFSLVGPALDGRGGAFPQENKCVTGPCYVRDSVPPQS
jgi:hypothetical protein